MRVIDKRVKVSRRDMLRTAAAAPAVAAMGGQALANGSVALVAVAEDTFLTLVKMARDLYPHDNIADKYYAGVMQGLDAGAKDDAAAKELLEKGAQLLDGLSERMGFGKYLDNAKEEDRVAVLREVEKQNAPFFQKVRGSLITGLYGNAELWPVFGYEGESASKGGYINRGFNDLNWL
jgi:hypothetical protein